MPQSLLHWQFLITNTISVSLNFGTCYITSRWSKFWVENANCLYVLVMSRTRFRVNPLSIVAWMSRNSLIEASAKSEGYVTATGFERRTTLFVNKHSTVSPNWLNDWALFWVLICTVHLTVCFCHVIYAFQSEFTLCSCLNVKKLLARSKEKL